MNKMDDPLKLVTDLKPAMLDRLVEEGYSRRRDDDLARAMAAGPGSASAPGRRPPSAGHGRRWRAGVLSVAATGAAAGLIAGVVVATSGGHHGGAKPAVGGAHHVTAMPAIRLTAAQQVLYRLSAAALTAPRQAGQGRYVELSQVQTGPAAHYPKNFRSLVNQKNLPPQLKSFYRSLVRKYGWKPKIVISRRTDVFDSRAGDIWEYQQAPGGGPGGTYVSRHGSPTQAQFAAWPTAAGRLRALLLAQAKTLNDTVPGQTSDDLIFQRATYWLWNPLVTPALRAGLYKVLAATPGVVVKTGVADGAGRPAIEISRLDHTTKELSSTYEAPATGAVLESFFSDAGSDVYLSVTRHATLPADPYSGG